MAVSTQSIERLREQLDQLQHGSAHAERSRPGLVTTGWSSIDAVIQGLQRGVIHEWFGGLSGTVGDSKQDGQPPMQILMHLARCAVPPGRWGVVVWVGRSCWPHPQTLAESCGLLERTLFVAERDGATRLWATELSLRSPAVAGVVADGTGLTMSATRRLQLAAGSGRALALIARPYHELRELSAAATRWVVQPMPTANEHPRWSVELLRCKGEQPDPRAPRQWVLEGGDAKGVVVISAEVVDRPSAAAVGDTRQGPRKHGRASA